MLIFHPGSVPLNKKNNKKTQLLIIFAVYQPQLYSTHVRLCLGVGVSVCVSVCVHENSKNNGSILLKLEHIVVYENSSDEFNIGHYPIKCKVMI